MSLRTCRIVLAWLAIVSALAATSDHLGAVEHYRSDSQKPAAIATQSQQASDRVPVSAQRALLDRYCVSCHNERLKTANLLLDKIDLGRVSADVEIWERVLRKLRAAAMPPAGVPRPDKAASDAFIAWLETTIDRAAAAAPNPGRPVAHRLNRVEYTNAIRDLLAVEIDGRSLLPGDDSGFGFDNIGDVLTVSPSLLERYMLAAQRIGRLAIGDPAMRPDSHTYKAAKLAWQDGQMSEDLPFGSRGGIAVRHRFPMDGEYVITIDLQREVVTGVVRGLDSPNQIDVRLDGERVKLVTLPRQTGSASGSPEEGGADVGIPLEVRVPVRAGSRLVGISFLKGATWAFEGVGPERMPRGTSSLAQGVRSTPQYGRVDADLDMVRIDGPFKATAADTDSRRRIFVCKPSGVKTERGCATTILRTLARRAYRRPVNKGDVETLLRFYDVGRAGGGFEKGIQLALEKLLVTPDFLFRVERDPANKAPGTAYPVNSVEMASRLSFFLWSSLPDDQLLDLGAQGKLTNAVVLEQQVRRMLGDPRSKALIENFGGQWLYLRNLRSLAPDLLAFPDFDDNLREAFQRETELFLESQVREDRPVMELLTANYTFLNERLARHYAIPHVYGNRFRRVTYGDDRRAGLLGHGSVLTVTSYAHRTSPVLRGKWLLENILSTPPPEPPANVPPLDENQAKGKPASVRERMERHRRNPACAGCHTLMDPLGFALENFDALGRWRTKDSNVEIDASGAFPNGTKFNGAAEFRKALLNYREAFVRTVIEKLMTYALGRGLEPYDMPAVRAVMRDAVSSDYRWSSLILGIIKSTPFQMRRVES